MIGLSIPLLAVIHLGLALLPRQPGRQTVFTDPLRAYTMTLPAGWRQMTPVEARELRPKLPPDIATLLVLSRLDRFGTIDAWQQGSFDGRCLTVTREEGEPALTDATLEQVRMTARSRSSGGKFRYEIDEPRITSAGKRSHPAIECVVEIRDAAGQPLARLLELVVPTGGNTLRFSFRARPADFDAALPVFRDVAASLEFARPPEGQKELSDKLQMPLIIGGVVGLILLVLYKTRKR